MNSPAKNPWAPLAMRVMGLALLWLGLTADCSAQAEEKRVLFVDLNDGVYESDIAKAFSTLVDAGAIATYVRLDEEGRAANYLAAHNYDQVWVVDLSGALEEDTTYSSDWEAIAKWYQAPPSAAIICDARFLHSYVEGRWENEGQSLTENYYMNLKQHGKGLLLATDHEDSPIKTYLNGINTINEAIGLNPFHGVFNLTWIPVNTSNPLMTTPNDLGAHLHNDYTPGQAPYGLQPNGRMLHTVAWHSGDNHTPGISSTIQSTSGISVEILFPNENAIFAQGESITFEAECSNVAAPVTYTWVSDIDGQIGTGSNFVTSTLTGGKHAVTVTAVDALSKIDTDSIFVTVASEFSLQIEAAVKLLWPTERGVRYQLQWSPELDPLAWQDVGDPIVGDGTVMNAFDGIESRARGFYQIIVVP